MTNLLKKLETESCFCRLLKVNEKGSVPVVKDLGSSKWYTDSGDFVNLPGREISRA